MSQLKINVNKLYLFLLMTVVILSCSRKDSDYWINPKNQNGDISDFYATPEYCKKLHEHCPDFKQLILLENKVIDNFKQLSFLPAPTKADNSTLIILQQTEFVSNELALACGGFCENVPSLPILPYRTVDVKAFTKYNLEGFKELINKHITYIANIDSIELSKERESILTKVDLIRKQNVVGALIKFYEIELELIEINNTVSTNKTSLKSTIYHSKPPLWKTNS